MSAELEVMIMCMDQSNYFSDSHFVWIIIQKQKVHYQPKLLNTPSEEWYPNDNLLIDVFTDL